LTRFLEEFESENLEKITAENLVREFLKKCPQYQKIKNELLQIFSKRTIKSFLKKHKKWRKSERRIDDFLIDNFAKRISYKIDFDKLNDEKTHENYVADWEKRVINFTKRRIKNVTEIVKADPIFFILISLSICVSINIIIDGINMQNEINNIHQFNSFFPDIERYAIIENYSNNFYLNELPILIFLILSIIANNKKKEILKIKNKTILKIKNLEQVILQKTISILENKLEKTNSKIWEIENKI